MRRADGTIKERTGEMGRKQIKERLVRESAYLEKLNLNELQVEETAILNARLQRLEPVWDEFSQIQSKIKILTAIEGDIVLADSIKNILDDCVKKQVLNIPNIVPQYVTGPSGDLRQPNVHLPTLKLNPFDGKFESWSEFHDTFIALVHNNKNLDDVLKFYYLRNSLTKEPTNLIKAMPATAANYRIAWQTLKDRYENKGLTVQNHIRALWEQPNVIKESHKELRNLFDNTTVGLRQLEALGEKVEGWDSLII
ncbi:hypothetical protein NQ317_001483 [Molorchus minor]|uniref:Uncharacterized protein n=1 Tax=Molorchus minor TaxID=1323400 RepID=A0ABQ9IRB9_9CUCU|nr:hypothetical protein NQ317_001483 [Molorchus minor]